MSSRAPLHAFVAPEHVADHSTPRPQLRLQLGRHRRVATWQQVEEHDAGVVERNAVVQCVCVLDNNSGRTNTARAAQRSAHS